MNGTRLDARDFIESCAAHGVTMRCTGDDLTIEGPSQHVTHELVHRIRDHKLTILAILRSAPLGCELESTRDRNVESFKASDTDVSEAADSCLDWDDGITPHDAECAACGSLMAWWDLTGALHCIRCDPPIAAVQLLERTQMIRAKLKIEQAAEAVSRIAFYKSVLRRDQQKKGLK